MDLNDLKPPVRVQDRYGYVYHTLFTRPTDGKEFHYIGQKLGRKINKRYYGSGHRIKQMVKAYGLKNNTKVFLLGWHTDQASLNEAEIRLIHVARKAFGSSCINLKYGGARGGLSISSRLKISCALKGRSPSADSNRKRSESHKARPPFTSEHRQNISKARLGIVFSPETLKKMSEVKMGKRHSAETKRRMSEAKRGILKPKVTCPFCGCSGGKPAMSRWHFENCTIP